MHVRVLVCLSVSVHMLLKVNFVDSSFVVLLAVNLTTTTLTDLEFQLLMAAFPD
jgi:uncharacterized membrane protein